MPTPTLTPIPRVVDLSHYDDVQDKFAGAERFGIWGVINKLSEGTAVRDHSFGWRLKPAHDQGLEYAGYHFLRPGRIVQQAEWFLSGLPSDITGIGIALDHEDRGVPLKDARLWLETVHSKIGRWPSLYSGFLIKEQIGKASAADRAFWSKIRLWLSHYSARPTWPKTVWAQPWLIQYTGDGVGPKPHDVPGIVMHPPSGIDINHFAGTRAELTASWAS